MKDIITPIRPDIIHDFKQISIPVKTNEQILIPILRHQAVSQRKSLSLSQHLRSVFPENATVKAVSPERFRGLDWG